VKRPSLLLGKKDRKKERQKKTNRKTNRHTERQRTNSIFSTSSPSGKVRKSENSNQFLNGHVVKLQPVLSSKFSNSVQERHTSNRLLKGYNDDFHLSALILPVLTVVF